MPAWPWGGGQRQEGLSGGDGHPAGTQWCGGGMKNVVPCQGKGHPAPGRGAVLHKAAVPTVMLR